MSQILVIEDNKENRRIIEKLLVRAGHQVVLAEDGETGLKQVFESSPDLILTDLGLPDIEGQTVIALIRQQPGMDQIPIVALTGWPEEHAHTMVDQYGCDGVITKPISAHTFADKIKAFLIQKD